MSPKLTLFPIDRFKGFQPTGGTRTAVLMDLRPNQMITPFLKAKRALYFSKILYKYYGAELVVSENHRSGALFHFKEDRQSKRGCCLTEEWMHEACTSKGGARSMKKVAVAGKRAPQSPRPRVRRKRVRSADTMLPLSRNARENPGSGKSKSRSRFAGSFLGARAALIPPTDSSAGGRTVAVCGRCWKDPIRRNPKLRRCL